MKKEVKEKWVAALRSGEYKKTSRTLSRHGAYCCLGVLCELAVSEGVIRPARIGGNGCGTYGKSSDAVPPPTVLRWAGLTKPVPVTSEGYLTTINDRGRSFKHIADLIEKEL